MKIALDWIADYLDRPIGPEEAAEALINAGLPIESITPAGNTQVLDVEVTSNRTDCLSHVGLARELAALTGRQFRLPPIQPPATGPDAAGLAKVAVEDPQGCPFYSARLIQNVKVAPSPYWMIQRLAAIGLRSINNVVDVTNYVLMELGQPLHAFDFDRLQEKRVVVRRAAKGEKIQAINDKAYDLDPSMLVIADAVRPVAVAGVMGGKDTEVGEPTVNVLLESARFDPLLIRSTARALALMSDSSYRFERGLDPTLAELASLRAAQLILQTTGGTLAAGVVAAGQARKEPLPVSLRLARLAQVLGITIPADKAVAILAALGFQPRLDGQTIHCLVPTHRLDVEREIDLVEEVARVHGYSHLPVLDRVSHPVTPETSEERATSIIRAALNEAGFNETVTLTFLPQPEAQGFLPQHAELVRPRHGGWKEDALRPSLLPSLLHVRRTNQNVGIPDARLFEHAEVFWQAGAPAQTPPTQYRMLAVLGNDVAEVRGALDLVVARLSPDARLEVRPQDRPWMAPGIAATLVLSDGPNRHDIGTIGEISRQVQSRYDLRHACAGAEVLWDRLLEIYQPVRRAKPLPRFPGVTRDLSVVVPDAIRWADVRDALLGAGLQHLAGIDFVGTFRSKQVGAGHKSLTLSLDFRDPAATLRAEQVDAQVKAAVDLLTAKFGAALRA